MKKLQAAALALLSAFLLVGCVGPDTRHAQALVDAVKDEHLAYVQADPAMTPEKIERRKRTWQAFEFWIQAAQR